MATELLKYKKYKKDKSKIAKWKGTNNFKPKVKKNKFFKALQNIYTILLINVVLKFTYVFDWVSSQYLKVKWAKKNTFSYSFMLWLKV